jgi:hypothetical protein
MFFDFGRGVSGAIDFKEEKPYSPYLTKEKLHQLDSYRASYELAKKNNTSSILTVLAGKFPMLPKELETYTDTMAAAIESNDEETFRVILKEVSTAFVDGPFYVKKDLNLKLYFFQHLNCALRLGKDEIIKEICAAGYFFNSFMINAKDEVTTLLKEYCKDSKNIHLIGKLMELGANPSFNQETAFEYPIMVIRNEFWPKPNLDNAPVNVKLESPSMMKIINLMLLYTIPFGIKETHITVLQQVEYNLEKFIEEFEQKDNDPHNGLLSGCRKIQDEFFYFNYLLTTRMIVEIFKKQAKPKFHNRMIEATPIEIKTDFRPSSNEIYDPMLKREILSYLYPPLKSKQQPTERANRVRPGANRVRPVTLTL